MDVSQRLGKIESELQELKDDVGGGFRSVNQKLDVAQANAKAALEINTDFKDALSSSLGKVNRLAMFGFVVLATHIVFTIIRAIVSW